VAQIGVITREPNPPGIDLELWRRIIVATPYLRRPGPRDIINPFTGKPAVHTPPDTDAEIIVAAAPIGAIATSLADPCELDVWAPDDTHDDVERVAIAIAAELGGIYISFRESV
jgi:hypothetical protein